ncbi:MAG: hypothetical protein R3E88_14615 [Myxococcota bacterium]
MDAPAPEAPRALVFLVGIERTDDPAAPLVVAPYEHVCHRGAVRPAVLASATDVAGSLAARAGEPVESVLTTDLSVRAPARRAPALLRTRARTLREGASAVAVELVFDDGADPVATGITTFRRRIAKDASRATPGAVPARMGGARLSQPIERAMGLEVVDAARGRVALAPSAAVCNPNGSLQGTAVAVFVEVAALALAEHALGPRVATELDIRYVAASGRGPLAAEARFVARPEDGALRVDLVDEGAGGRTTAAAFVRVAPPPA